MVLTEPQVPACLPSSIIQGPCDVGQGVRNDDPQSSASSWGYEVIHSCKTSPLETSRELVKSLIFLKGEAR